LFQDFGPDIVIHLSGLKSVERSKGNPLEFYEQNIDSTISVLATMEKFGTKNILFSSSASVYGNCLNVRVDENFDCNPISTYAKSKYFIEQIISDWTFSRPGSSAVILRYFNPIGAHGSNLIGDDPKYQDKNAISIFSDCALGITKNISIFGSDHDTPDGTCVRDYIHIEDVAEGHSKAINFLTRNTGTEIINLGTGKGASVFELVKALEAASNKKIPCKIVNRRDGEISYSVADPSKAKKLLSWEAKKSLDQMCRDTWRWVNREN
jgi:UDP-glucose 4-epimerase